MLKYQGVSSKTGEMKTLFLTQINWHSEKPLCSNFIIENFNIIFCEFISSVYLSGCHWYFAGSKISQSYYVILQ